MSSSDKIMKMFREAELYRKQGLLDETVALYREIEKIVRNSPNFKNKEAFLEKLAVKIKHLDHEINAYAQASEIPEIPEKARELMRSMFSLDDPEVHGSVLLGEAIALSRFGQYEAARPIFENLFSDDSLRVHAAKKMLEYGIEYKTKLEMARLVQQWEADNRFPAEESGFLVQYLQGLLKVVQAPVHSGSTVEAEPKFEPESEPESEVSDDRFFDIRSVGLELENGDKTNLEVSFQHGIRLNVIVPENNQAVLKLLQAGERMHNIRLRALGSVLSATLYVMRIRKIDFGPQTGSTSITFKVISVSSS